MQQDSAHIKTCRVCHVEKSVAEFYKAKRGLLGVRSTCGACEVIKNKARVAEWRKNNKDRYHAHAKAWVDRNQEQYKNILRENYRKNIDAKKQYSRQWVEVNRERKNATRKVWRDTPERRAKESAAASAWAKNNRARSAAICAARHARKLNATPAWANKFFIEEIYDLANRRTKVMGFKWHVDHIVPLKSKKVCGLHVECNLQVIPASSNLRKSNIRWPDMP